MIRMKIFNRSETIVTACFSLSLLLATGCACRPNKYFTLDLGQSVTMKLVRIDAGAFVMGSPRTEKERYENEGPQRQVTISKPFYMGITEVTQAQWRVVMSTEPWKGKEYAKPGDNYPAGNITWTEALAFCTALSKKTGVCVRLPTEAEWEYACRAGTTSAYCFGNTVSRLGGYAWYKGNAESKGEMYAHCAGRKTPNQWGLYDMHGNTWEWCSDWYAARYAKADTRDPKGPLAGELRVLRGGSWWDRPEFCRAASRFFCTPPIPYINHGFRVVVSGGPGAN